MLSKSLASQQYQKGKHLLTNNKATVVYQSQSIYDVWGLGDNATDQTILLPLK